MSLLLLIIALVATTSITTCLATELETTLALESMMAELLSSAGSNLKTGMGQCVLSMPEPDSKMCITNILGSGQSIAAMAWSPKSMQLGASLLEETTHHRQARTQHHQSSSSLRTNNHVGVETKKGFVGSYLDAINPIKGYNRYQVKKRRKKDVALSKQVEEQLQKQHVMKNRTDWSELSWEDGTKDMARCATWCVPNFFFIFGTDLLSWYTLLILTLSLFQLLLLVLSFSFFSQVATVQLTMHNHFFIEKNHN